MISVWMKFFSGDSYTEVDSAITSLIQGGAKFVPVIGEIRAEMDKGKPKNTWALNQRPYPQSFIDAVHKFLEEVKDGNT